MRLDRASNRAARFVARGQLSHSTSQPRQSARIGARAIFSRKFSTIYN